MNTYYPYKKTTIFSGSPILVAFMGVYDVLWKNGMRTFSVLGEFQDYRHDKFLSQNHFPKPIVLLKDAMPLIRSMQRIEFQGNDAELTSYKIPPKNVRDN